ncbi:RNA polymerase II elongation factor [Zygosaccharomyces mellis]|uniref:Transcription elongation factor n=1 Tax=Zygosaccharomyces mellis TaxID=42258 RepID=A0A4C2EEA6_9SACH|nr:RNA polymerase II elongation factor [Zygosaccharomyces mellis]
MDSKEVSAHVKNLEKFKTNDETVLDILKSLEKEVVPTEKLLRETKVGVEVNKFKKSQNAEIVRIVKRMISSWKETINKSKKAKMQSQPQQASTSQSPSSQQLSPTEPRKQDKFVSSKPRNSKNDGVDTNIHNHKLRDMVIRALYDALAKESEHPPSSVLDSAKSIEEEMNKLNNCDENEKAYKDKYRIIYSNIISKNNPDLKHKITNGDVTPQYLVSCDPKELAPEHLKKKLEEIAKQNLHNAQGATIQRSITDRFTCGKCKEKKVSYYQLQTRSADEPLTTFCTCESCGNRWKFS